MGDGFFSIEYGEVRRIAGRLSEAGDVLTAAASAAGDVHAVAGPGFTSVAAAWEAAHAWLAEVRRLATDTDEAGRQLTGSVATYRATDRTAAHGIGSRRPW